MKIYSYELFNSELSRNKTNNFTDRVLHLFQFKKGLTPVIDNDRYQHKNVGNMFSIKIFNHIQIYIQIIHYYSLFTNELFAKKLR